MRPQTSDPTAGKRARAIHAHPETPQRIQDPTDPRYGFGTAQGQTGQLGRRRVDRRRVDPTDPECGELSA